MYKLVLLRHGESQWNRDNRFTGWTDVDLSEKGVQEAKDAGTSLAREGYTFDIAYTSVLKRAIRTLWLVLDTMDLMWIPVERNWRLNERHYGALQGLNKSEVAKKVGPDQVQLWRRSYNVTPPKLEKKDSRYPGRVLRYQHVSEDELPLAECLKDTVVRVLPFWKEVVVPAIKGNKKVLIVAHGNSLRALVKYLGHISDEEIVKLEIPTGVPLVYDLDDALSPIKSNYLTV